jgi:hypothetical protein
MRSVVGTIVFASTVEPFTAAFEDKRSTLLLIHLYREISPHLIDRALAIITALKPSVALLTSTVRGVVRLVVKGRLSVIYN